MRKRIAFDLDDTLADFMSAYFNYYNEKFGTDFNRKDLKEYNISSLPGGPATDKDAIESVLDFYTTSYFKNIKILPNVREAIEKLAQKHDLMIITSRPLNLEKETKEWLDNNFKTKFFDTVLTEHFLLGSELKKKKSDVCIEYNVDTLVDDHLLFIEDCHNHGIDTILVDSPWNRHYRNDRIKRIKNLTELLTILQ